MQNGRCSPYRPGTCLADNDFVHRPSRCATVPPHHAAIRIRDWIQIPTVCKKTYLSIPVLTLAKWVASIGFELELIVDVSQAMAVTSVWRLDLSGIAGSCSNQAPAVSCLNRSTTNQYCQEPAAITQASGCIPSYTYKPKCHVRPPGNKLFQADRNSGR